MKRAFYIVLICLIQNNFGLPNRPIKDYAEWKVDPNYETTDPEHNEIENISAEISKNNYDNYYGNGDGDDNMDFTLIKKIEKYLNNKERLLEKVQLLNLEQSKVGNIGKYERSKRSSSINNATENDALIEPASKCFDFIVSLATQYLSMIQNVLKKSFTFQTFDEMSSSEIENLIDVPDLEVAGYRIMRENYKRIYNIDLTNEDIDKLQEVMANKIDSLSKNYQLQRNKRDTEQNEAAHPISTIEDNLIAKMSPKEVISIVTQNLISEYSTFEQNQEKMKEMRLKMTSLVQELDTLHQAVADRMDNLSVENKSSRNKRNIKNSEVPDLISPDQNTEKSTKSSEEAAEAVGKKIDSIQSAIDNLKQIQEKIKKMQERISNILEENREILKENRQQKRSVSNSVLNTNFENAEKCIDFLYNFDYNLRLLIQKSSKNSNLDKNMDLKSLHIDDNLLDNLQVTPAFETAAFKIVHDTYKAAYNIDLSNENCRQLIRVLGNHEGAIETVFAYNRNKRDISNYTTEELDQFLKNPYVNDSNKDEFLNAVDNVIQLAVIIIQSNHTNNNTAVYSSVDAIKTILEEVKKSITHENETRRKRDTQSSGAVNPNELDTINVSDNLNIINSMNQTAKNAIAEINNIVDTFLKQVQKISEIDLNSLIVETSSKLNQSLSTLETIPRRFEEHTDEIKKDLNIGVTNVAIETDRFLATLHQNVNHFAEELGNVTKDAYEEALTIGTTFQNKLGKIVGNFSVNAVEHN